MKSVYRVVRYIVNKLNNVTTYIKGLYTPNNSAYAMVTIICSCPKPQSAHLIDIRVCCKYLSINQVAFPRIQRISIIHLFLCIVATQIRYQHLQVVHLQQDWAFRARVERFGFSGTASSLCKLGKHTPAGTILWCWTWSRWAALSKWCSKKSLEGVRIVDRESAWQPMLRWMVATHCTHTLYILWGNCASRHLTATDRMVVETNSETCL